MPDERTATRTEQVDAGEFAAASRPSLRCDAGGSKRPCYHLVVKGDSLSAIALEYKVKYPDDIKRWNPEFFKPPRDPNKIFPNEKLTIKKAGAA
jgi:hypothetical protein